MLEEEVEELAGRRHARDESGYRHGHNPGSVRLAGQRHPVRVPRVRGRAGEVRLASYERLHGSAGEVNPLGTGRLRPHAGQNGHAFRHALLPGIGCGDRRQPPRSCLNLRPASRGPGPRRV